MRPGTDAGEVLKIRQGSLPAVTAALMTSSDDLPAGISCPLTCSFGWAAFQAATACLPHFTSSGLLEYQILIGPCAWLVLLAEAPPPWSPHPASARISTEAVAD